RSLRSLEDAEEEKRGTAGGNPGAGSRFEALGFRLLCDVCGKSRTLFYRPLPPVAGGRRGRKERKTRRTPELRGSAFLCGLCAFFSATSALNSFFLTPGPSVRQAHRKKREERKRVQVQVEVLSATSAIKKDFRRKARDSA
ncbi:MAG TPA: hypothetical protein VNX25_07395, partial [Verrucomicrobiae bacterium]|nr:hypothetical protein [Verrucomicrobiae bacterium]